MAEPEKGERKQPLDWAENIGYDAEKPGYYDSPFAEHSGYIQFPNPFMLVHLKKWWQTGVDPLEDKGPLKWDDRWQVQLDAALMLLCDYGQYKLDGIPLGDLKDENVPAAVAEWITTCARHYILRQLDPRKRLALSTVI